MFIFRGIGTGISTAPAGAPFVSSLACLGDSSSCWLDDCASVSWGLGLVSSCVGCLCAGSTAEGIAGLAGRSESCGLGGRSLSWGFRGRSASWGFGGKSDSCGFGGRSDSCGLGGRSETCGFCGTSTGSERSAGCGILGGGSVGLVIVSEALTGGVSWACEGFCSTSGPGLVLSTEGRWIVSIFRSATKRVRTTCTG